MKQRTYYQQVYWDELKATSASLGAPRDRASTDLARVFRQHLPHAVTILDVGCGNGSTYAPLLRQYARLYVGIDLSFHALQQAHRFQGVSTDLEQSLPFRPDQFDIIVCMEVLEHLFDPLSLLHHMREVLQPSGLLIVSVPNTAHISHRVRLLGGKFVAGGHPQTADTPWCDPHIRFFTRRALHAMLQAAGFHPIATYGIDTALLTSMPILSVVLARMFGREQTRLLSHQFDVLGHWWPTLFAGHLVVVSRYGGKRCSGNDTL